MAAGSPRAPVALESTGILRTLMRDKGTLVAERADWLRRPPSGATWTPHRRRIRPKPKR